MYTQHTLPKLVAGVATLAMLRLPGQSAVWAFWQYSIASFFYYVSTTVNANVVDINATKYAIADDAWFNQEAITYVQMVTQMMLGKVLGPILGMIFYSGYGQVCAACACTRV